MEAAQPAFPEQDLEQAPPFRERLVGVLVRPRETFARLADRDAWFWPAILLLVGYTLYYLAIGVGSARWQLALMSTMLQRSGQQNPSSQSAQTAILAFVPAVQLFAAMLQVPVTIATSWALRTSLFYGLARLLGGAKPHWARVLAMVGWAWVPLFIQYTILGILMLTVPQVLALFLPLPKPTATPPTMQMMRSNSLVQLVLYVSPFVIWNLALCVVGVAELFRLPRWKASLVVLVPTVLQLLFMVAMYFVSLSMMEAFGAGALPAPNGPSR